jgi:hypothetical protein
MYLYVDPLAGPVCAALWAQQVRRDYGDSGGELRGAAGGNERAYPAGENPALGSLERDTLRRDGVCFSGHGAGGLCTSARARTHTHYTCMHIHVHICMYVYIFTDI